MKSPTKRLQPQFWSGLVAVIAAALATPSAFAASQTWSNAPTDVNWTTAANWVGNAVPGGLNQTGNTVQNDVATFNTPIPGSGIGGAANPVLTDDATVLNTRSRQIGGITFDTANVGAYYISNASAALLPSAGNPQQGILNISHNGSIQMTAAVTNSQHIMVPLYVRLPSSTAGIYNFVNNATPPTATLYIGGATNDSANTRGTEWRLAGSNTGTNTIGGLSAGTTTSGANGLTKNGSGTWILAGPNDFRAQTVIRIQEGTLVVKDQAAFNGATTATVTNTGVLQIDGVSLFQLSLNLHRGGVIRMNGSSSLNGVAVGTATGTDVTLATTSAADVFPVGTGLALNSVVSGGAPDSILRVAGPGTVQLQTANTYVGSWSFDAGTNQVLNFGVLGTGANASVGPGAVFDYSLLGPTTYTPSTAGFGGRGTGVGIGGSAATVVGAPGAVLDLTSKNVNLTFTPASLSGDTTRPALYVAAGGLTLGNNTFFINNAGSGPLGVGTYRLVQQAGGSITSGGGYAALVGGNGLAAGTAASIQVSGGNVDLVVVIYVPKNLVWSGSGANWDVGSSTTWLNGATPSVFNNSDNVTFNSVGAANPFVNLVGTLAPATVTVDNSGTDYTFSGGGQVAGTASVKKLGTGVLTLQTANSYAGGTVVSNGTLRVGATDAISSVGSGDVAVYDAGVIDLNGFNNTINGFSGNGAVDVASGGASILTIGNNNSGGTFSGSLRNTSGTLALVKSGTGGQTLSGSNSLSAGVTVAAGTLIAANPRALGTNTVTVNAGLLEVPNDLLIGGLAGTGGSIANNTTANTNTLVIDGGNSTTYSGSIVNGSGGGGLAVRLLSGSLTLGGNNTYTGGTYVGSGATFAIPNAPAAVGGFLIASNGATLNLSGGSGTPGTPNSITTVAGATVTFNSGAEGKIWQAQFNGSANSTNIFIGPVSFGQSLSFSNFPGVVIFSNNTANANVRFFNGDGISGGENTTFVFQHVNAHTRDSQTVRLGEIIGGNRLAGIGDQAGIVSWEIGAKNTPQTFQGYISGVNNSIVKVGTASLTLDGRMYYTNTVTLPDFSVVDYTLFTNGLTYLGSTTVSNGTLKIVAPNNLNTSSNINIAGGVLDATQIGTFTNQTTLDANSIEQPTNTVAVVSGVVNILANQTLNGFGSILGSATSDVTAVVNVGDYLAVGGALTKGVGTLSVSGSIALNGTVNMDLNRTATPTADRINAASFSGSGATLNITNLGPTLVTGDTYQLFSGPVTAFSVVNLPAANADNSVTYVWENRIAIDGSIKVTSGGSPVDPTPTNITSTVVGNQLQLSWPSSHTGWTLQAQTNAINVGLSGTWFDVAGSAATNQVFLPLNPANPTVFYRLRLAQP